MQIVHRQAAPSWDEQDWRTVPPAEQTPRLEQLFAIERQKGFDLTQAPVFRCTLIRVAEKQYWFVWHCPHFLKDGWSSSLLLREVLDLYENPALILPAARPYRDYIAWLTGKNRNKAEKFWRERLLGLTGPTSLPEQKPWEPSRAGEYAKISLVLPTALTSALQTLTQRQRLTLNTLCQGAWALVLHQDSGQEELVFGVTVSGRSAPLPEIESRVGLFMNTLPLRVKISPDLPWEQWLQTLMQEQNTLEQYAYTSLDQIKTWAGLPPDQRLFLSNVRFQNFPWQEIGSRANGQLEIEDFLSADWWHYPLNLIFIPGSALELMISYEIHCFEPAAIQKILQKLAAVLSQISQSAPGESLNSLWTDAPRSNP